MTLSLTTLRLLYQILCEKTIAVTANRVDVEAVLTAREELEAAIREAESVVTEAESALKEA